MVKSMVDSDEVNLMSKEEINKERKGNSAIICNYTELPICMYKYNI